MFILAYLIFTFALLVTCESTDPPSVSTTDKTHANIVDFLKHHLQYYCDYFCKQDACPPECPNAFIGSWARRRTASKRAFDQSSEFNGLTFDDYGLFMKLLGRDLDKKRR